MYRIESKIDKGSEIYKENSEKNKAQHLEFKEKLDKVKQGGPERSRKRNNERGKILPRERVEKLIDRNTHFVEM